MPRRASSLSPPSRSVVLDRQVTPHGARRQGDSHPVLRPEAELARSHAERELWQSRSRHRAPSSLAAHAAAFERLPAETKDLLRSSWRRAFGALVPSNAADTGLRDELLFRYSEAHRHYHTVQHLAECLGSFARVAGGAERPAELETALWFHDAVYDVASHENERQSADWAKRAILSAGGSPEAAERVFGRVMATRHLTPPRLPDERLLVDIDLAILGAAPDRFAEYEAQVLREYAANPPEVLRAGRRAILEQFLARPFLYGTSSFRSSHEARARANLEASVAKLSAESPAPPTP